VNTLQAQAKQARSQPQEPKPTKEIERLYIELDGVLARMRRGSVSMEKEELQPGAARWLQERKKGQPLWLWHWGGRLYRPRVWRRGAGRVHPAFNEGDVTYFRPLYRQVVLALGMYPTNVTADAAFDAWYVYQCAALHSGIGAVPLNQHAHPLYERTTDGTPICPKELRMQPTFQFNHTNGYRALRFRCPLLFPQATGAYCDHAQFAKGKGCVKDVNWEPGGQMRVTLNRDGPLYHGIYNQRTAAERINSQAQALGIERPKVRNIHSVRHLNTLIYLVINVRVLADAKSINKGLLQMN